MTFDPASVQALTFDVFGTVTDWRTTIIREGCALGQEKGFDVDWAAFADDWRGGYEPAMDRVRRGLLPWTTVDRLHRMILEELLDKYNVAGLSEQEKHHFNRVWHRLDIWPDVPEGLNRLRGRYLVNALSNGNVALLANMAKYAGLPWDCILSAEHARHYKPDAEVYLKAAELLDLPPDQILMVAAHNHDLRGAQRAGFRTVFIPRPLEYGPGGPAALRPDAPFDLVANDIEDLASWLGV
jgi:2-haloacid dehalogenase